MLQKRASRELIRSSRPDLAYFPIYSAWTVDTDGEAILDTTLMDVAHDWMIRGRSANVDIEHDGQVVNCRVVESWMTAKGDPRIRIPNTWAGGMKFFDPVIVRKVEAGEINGVSLLTEYPPARTVYPTVVSTPIVARGVTELSLDPNVPQHSHSVEIGFDDTSWEIPGISGESLGHRHPYKYATATEFGSTNHAHRIDLNRLEIEYATKVQLVTWLTNVSVIAISLVKHGANWQPLVGLKAREVIKWPGR